MSSPFAAVVTPTLSAECLLPAVGASVRGARTLVRDELGRWGADDLVDDCCVIVSELVTNVIQHAGTAFALRIKGGSDWVYGEIFDTGEGFLCQREADLDATSGRGLLIVENLADDWGVANARHGKVVWFMLTRGLLR